MEAKLKKILTIIFLSGILITIYSYLYLPNVLDSGFYKVVFGDITLITLKIVPYIIYASLVGICVAVLWLLLSGLFKFSTALDLIKKFVVLNRLKAPFFVLGHPFMCFVGLAILNIAGVEVYKVELSALFCLSFLFAFISIISFWFIQFNVLKFFNHDLTIENFIHVKTSVHPIFFIIGALISFCLMYTFHLDPKYHPGMRLFLVSAGFESIIPSIFYASRYFFGFFDDFSRLKKKREGDGLSYER